MQVNHDIAEQIMTELHQVSGLTDLHIQQLLDYPTLDIAVDRTKAFHRPALWRMSEMIST